MKKRMRVAITAVGVSHQTSHEVLGHYVVRNVTRFQSCRPNNYFVLTHNHRENILKRIIQEIAFATCHASSHSYTYSVVNQNKDLYS